MMETVEGLAEVALLVAQDEYPDLDVAAELRRLDDLADEVAARFGPEDPVEARLDALLEWFVAAGFRGDTVDYYNPRNSFLNDVLDRRRGIPITLALVLVEVGRRLDIPLVPLGLPGHVMVGWAGDGEPFWIDPFDPTARLDEADCHARVEQVHSRSISWDPRWLEPLTPRLFLTRLLNNLRGIYIQQGDTVKLRRVLERLLELNPSAIDVRRDLGLVWLNAGRPITAAMYLEPYLERVSATPEVEQFLAYLRGQLARAVRLN